MKISSLETIPKDLIKGGAVAFSVRCRDRFPNGPVGERTLQKEDSTLFERGLTSGAESAISQLPNPEEVNVIGVYRY